MPRICLATSRSFVALYTSPAAIHWEDLYLDNEKPEASRLQITRSVIWLRAKAPQKVFHIDPWHICLGFLVNLPTYALRNANDSLILLRMKSELNICKYTDYRVFLIAHAQSMKVKQASWSYGAWAKSMGLKTTSSITKIIQGEREAGSAITERLVSYFQFTDRQALYFRDLVRLQKIKKDPRLSALLMEKIGKEHPNSSLRIMDDKSFLVISNWYYLAIRELFRLGFQEDPEWISELLLFKVTSRDISNAIKTLLAIGLLTRDDNGRLQLAEGRIDTTNDIASEAIKRYHEQMLEHAKAALRRIPPEAREITSTSLAIHSKNIGLAKELMRKFKADFERLMEEDSGDQVYQFQMQFFPLTKKLMDVTHEN